VSKKIKNNENYELSCPTDTIMGVVLVKSVTENFNCGE
jgi:hypothetical protein